MNKLSVDKIRRHLIAGCVLALVAGAAPATIGADSSSSIYLIGDYGYLQKLDGNLQVVATGKAPGLARGRKIRDADISPDGERLFLAVSSDNPLVVVRTADLSIDENIHIAFPPAVKPWTMHSPFSIIATSARYLYMTDESYSAAPKPFSTVLVDLTAKTATPMYGYGFMSKMEIQVSPERERMALYDGGGLYFIDVPTGKVVDSITHELVGKDKWAMWFDVDWDKYIAEFYLIPLAQGEKTIEKICIEVESKSKWRSESLQSKTVFDFYNFQNCRAITAKASSKIYIQDSQGNIEMANRRGAQVLEKLGHAQFKEGSGRPVVSYVSPDEQLLFYQKDYVKASSGRRLAQGLSSLCVMDMETRQIIKTIESPQRIVGVLFGK